MNCKDCSQWKPIERKPGYGWCNKVQGVEQDGAAYIVGYDAYALFVVSQDFGCVQFEPK